MFSDCASLKELNAKRIALIKESPSAVADINSAYNKAKASLLSARVSYRKPPAFRATVIGEAPVFCAYPVDAGKVPKNTIVIHKNYVSI